MDIVVHDDMTAEDVEEWDSLNHIQIIVACEKEFDIKFKTEDILALNNVGDFINLIKKIKA